MEFILAIAVIVVLCLILGVGVDTMIVGALGFLGLIILAAAVFFAASMAILLTSKKKKAVFVDIEKKENARFKTAVYKMDDKEYPCIFPAEPAFVYKKDKPYNVMFNRRVGRVFDTFSILTCIFGFIFSIAAVAGAVVLILWLKNGGTGI